MHRWAPIAIAATVLATLAITHQAEAQTPPVKVTETRAVHPMWVCPMEPDRLYPLQPKARVDRASKELKEYRKQFQEEFLQEHPELERAVDAASLKVDTARKARLNKALAEAQKQLRDAKSKRDEALRDALQEDRKYNMLNQAHRAARMGNRKLIDTAFPKVVLNNGFIEVTIAPTLGMRVVNAVDLKTGQSLAATPKPRYYEQEPFSDIIGWTAGYYETSFPYFEHGMSVRQPAGYRVIRNEDGSVTVAMNSRFTQYQHPRHLSRYGHWSQRDLSVMVTLHPGQSRYAITTRVDNPNPLRRSDRCWTNHLMHVDQYDREHIIYPVGYIMPHGGGWAKPFEAAGGTTSYKGVSHFALYTDYEFCGAYSPTKNFNALIITDKDKAPGMKLYTRRQDGGFMELWTGSGVLFEDPGNFLNPYEPIEYTLYGYVVGGIGRVDFANRDVAIAVDDKQFKLTAPVAATVTVTDGSGRKLAAGKVGPGLDPLTGTFDKRIQVADADGKTLADVTFPLTYTDTRDRLPKVKSLGGKFRFELEENTNHRGAPTVRNAIPSARQLVKLGKVNDAEHAISLANACYRMGFMDLAKDVADLVGKTPEADYLRGLIAWERGQAVDFGQAGPDSYYMRALQAIQAGKTDDAVTWLDKLIAQRPRVFRPRLLRAFLKKDAETAKALAAEHPASPEAQLVLELLGVDGAAQAKAALLKDNPDADTHVAQFKQELTEGKWTHRKRFEPFSPEKDSK